MVNTSKLKLTLLQQEIIQFMFANAGKSFNARNLSKNLKVSHPAISKSLPLLEKEKLILIKKDKESKRFSIELNRNKKVIELKRIDNLKTIYESGLNEFLSEKFPSSTIILFGSYSFGEDTTESDIDIAVVGAKEKEIKLEEYEKVLKRKIFLHFYSSLKEINKNLRENILNGITLKGGIEL